MTREQYRLSDRLRRLIRRASLGIDDHHTIAMIAIKTEVLLSFAGVNDSRLALWLIATMPPLPGAPDIF